MFKVKVGLIQFVGVDAFNLKTQNFQSIVECKVRLPKALQRYLATFSILQHWLGNIERGRLIEKLCNNIFFSIFHIKSPTSTSWMLSERISPMFCNRTKDSRRPIVSPISQYRTYNLTVVAFSPSNRTELLFCHFASALNLDNKCWSNDQTTAIQGKVTDQVVVLKPKLIHHDGSSKSSQKPPIILHFLPKK